MRYALAALLLVACSGDPTIDELQEEFEEMQEEFQEEVDAVNACIAEWDVFVDEWNDLTIARDEAGEDTVVVDGESFEDYEAYATAKGYPLTYEEHCPEG